jgi:galactan endo-1,6-beta-galactosidase
VSLAWWAKAFGNRNDLADLFFTSNVVNFNNIGTPGLGFNIARYNAGASSSSSYNGSNMVTSPNIKASRQIDGFWKDGSNSSPASSSWDWTVDANQRDMLSKAHARGANILELFSNSPMWWMCNNHNPSGSTDGSSDNLRPQSYDQHAIYLANIAQYAKQHWGISFQSVEAFNEPSAAWWKADGTQEGCHFDVATQATVAGYLRTELDARGLQSTLVSASDENQYDEAVTTWKGLTTAAKNKIARINVHGYQEGGGRRDVLYSQASSDGKALWNSEYGEGDATGKRLASNLMLDLVWLHPSAWVYWQAVDGSGWGLVEGDNDQVSLGSPSQKYYVLAQFTRHIRPGMKILSGGSSNTIAAYDAANKKLVIVAVNWGDSQYLNFDLSKFKQPGTNGQVVARWSTQIGSGDQYVGHKDTTMSGAKFWSWFGSEVIQTFEVSNVII